MSEEPEQPQPAEHESAEQGKPRIRFALWLCAAVLVLALAALAAVRYVHSVEFHERARQFAVTQLEQATGGRVELARVEWNLARLEFELDGLQIHGTESASEAPLLRVEQARARVKWAALLRGRIALRELQVLHPRAHVDVYKDGSTNLPGAKLRNSRQAGPGEELFRLAIDQASLSDGVLQWNEERVKVNGTALGVFLELAYRPADNHYEGAAKVGEVRVQLPEWEPMVLGAEANFRLYPDRVEVPRLRVSQGHSWMEASGAVNRSGSPVAQFAYRAAGDAGELARLIRYRELESGAVQVSGEGTFRWGRGAAIDAGEYAVVGKAQAAGVTWANSTVRLEKMNGGLAFTLDRDRFNISSIFATALGGTVHGKLDASHVNGKESAGHIELETTGVQLGEALQVFSSRQLPLARLRLAGVVSGPLLATWQGDMRNARMEVKLGVQPLNRRGELPVTAAAQGTFDFKRVALELHNLEASDGTTHLTAHGRLAANSELEVDVASVALSELSPMVAAWRGSRARDLPVEFGGGVEFRGSLRGRLEQPTVAGHLVLRDFTSLLRRWEQKAGDAVPVEHIVRTHWDLLEGDVEYSQRRESLRNGMLRHGVASMGVDASIGLVNGGYDMSQPFSAHVRMNSTDASELQAMVGANYPVTGHVSGDVQVSGTPSQLHGSGRIAISDGSAWRQAVREARADVNFTEDQAQLRNIVVKSDAMQLTGAASINVATHEFGFDLKGTEVKIESLQVVRESKIRATGQATFEATGSGTPSAPVINGRLRLRKVAVNGQPLGDMNLDAVTRGAEMTVTARSNFKDAEVNLDGQIHLRGQMPMHVSGDVRSANLNLLESYLPLRHGAASEMKAHLEATGEALRPRDMTAELVVERWTTTYAGIGVSNDGPIRLKMANEVVHVEQFRISGEQGTRFLQVHGEVQLGGKREIDLSAEGSVNLKLLESADPNLIASGVANLNLQANGTLERPLLRGRLNVQNAAINYVDFPNGLNDITGTLVFNEDRLQVQELTARTGGGLLHCGGFITLSAAQGLGFNLSASGHEIRLRYPEGLSSTADAALLLTGSMKSAVLSGNITVIRMGLNPQFDFATYLVKGMRGAPAQKIDSPLNNLHMDVHVTSTPELQVQTSLARVSGNVDLHMRGTASRPVVLGRVNLLEGFIYFNATKYRMERGDLTFTNPVTIDPTLDVDLSARVRDYDITLGFHGPISRLTTSYRSDPPLSSSDILSLLALGRTSEETANPALMGTSQYQPAVSESASTALLGQALNATVSSRVQRLFGVSRLKIDPNVGGPLNSGLARVTVEQQISNNLTLTYISNLNQSSQQIIQFEYNINKDVSVVGMRDQTGVLSFDVLLRKRHK
jgi:translocation and assembly module TamB